MRLFTYELQLPLCSVHGIAALRGLPVYVNLPFVQVVPIVHGVEAHEVKQLAFQAVIEHAEALERVNLSEAHMRRFVNIEQFVCHARNQGV